jgi:hypothetical protein
MVGAFFVPELGPKMSEERWGGIGKIMGNSGVKRGKVV